MTNNQTILITGVTANQGGAVAQALQNSGFCLRGLTRKPESERAAALGRRGVDIVEGDLDDDASLRRALAGTWSVFGVQNAAEAGVEREEEQGKRLATLAREAGGVLPHTAVVKSPLSLALLLNGVLGHSLFVGFPIALAARRITNQVQLQYSGGLTIKLKERVCERTQF